jgi:acyl-coenzyme A synthetase/AMP-(fatty) acid ligase
MNSEMQFFDNIAAYNNRTALIDETGNVVLYSQLVSDADKMTGKIGWRCLVFFMARNCVESVVGYVGFLRNQIVPVLVNDTIAEPLLADLLEKYHPAYFYLPSERVTDIPGVLVYIYGSYTLLKLSYNEDYRIHPELALLLTTSGSTGSPKLVRQSYKNINVNTESIIEYLGITENDRAITTLPMSYTYGLSIINTHLYKGAVLILTDASLMEKRFWTLLKNEKAATFGGVPYTYEILKKLRFERTELPDLRYITQAGGKLSKELVAEFIAICKKKNIKLIIMYGQTEATARMSYLPWDSADVKAGSIGIPIPGGSFWIEDENSNIIKSPEITGELVYQGENVTLGYAENRFDLERGDDNHGVLHTGDMAKRDADGFYYIAGRKKRFLKLFGNRINLDEMENLLKKEGIECACVGEDDRMRIFVVSENEIDKTTAFIMKHTGINRNGFRVIAIKEIPRNESGKVLYSRLNEKWI